MPRSLPENVARAAQVTVDLQRLGQIEAELEPLNLQRDTLYDERVQIWERLRGLDPPMPFDQIGAPSRVSGVMVLKTLQKLRRNRADEAAS